MKKTLSLILALIMILSLLPTALAEDDWVTLRVECFDRNAAGFNVEDCMQLRYATEKRQSFSTRRRTAERTDLRKKC